MSVNGTEAVTPGLYAMAGSADATAKANDDHNMFLELMVAQLRYQDPLNPTDSTEFLSQNAQFTALEKMQDVADATNQLFAAQLAFGASNMIGRTVSWIDGEGNTQSGLVSAASFLASGPVLEVGDHQVPIASVTAVAATPATDGTPTTTEN